MTNELSALEYVKAISKLYFFKSVLFKAQKTQ